MAADHRLQFGKAGEDLACGVLRRLGYAILERRYRTRFGELDIIARDGATLVFIEVKARRTIGFGTPLEAITPGKRRKLCAMALEYVTSRRLTARPCRFDVVSIRFDGEQEPVVDIVPGAFDFSL